MTKLGRPFLKPTERKKPFTMRFSGPELKAYRQAASAEKKKVREWIADTLRRAAGIAS